MGPVEWVLISSLNLFYELWVDWAPALGTEISGIVWVTDMSYDWLMVAFENHQPIIANAGHINNPRKQSAERWCAVFLKFLKVAIRPDVVAMYLIYLCVCWANQLVQRAAYYFHLIRCWSETCIFYHALQWLCTCLYLQFWLVNDTFVAVVIIKGNGYEAHHISLLHVYFYTVKVFFDQSIQLNLWNTDTKGAKPSVRIDCRMYVCKCMYCSSIVSIYRY